MILFVNNNLGVLFLRKDDYIINSFDASRITYANLIPSPSIVVEAVRPNIQIVKAGDENG